MWYRPLKQWYDRRAAAPVRPALEMLEDRVVPTAAVIVDVPGEGIQRIDPTTQNWQTINGHDPTAAAVDGASGQVAASFPGFGTALWTPGVGWWVLTGAEASLLAVAGGGQNVVGEFPGSGVWAFHPNTGWIHLTAADASGLAADVNDNVVGEFPGNGVWYFSASNNAWTNLTAADAGQVVMGNVGFVVAAFPDHGVWADPFGGPWRQLSPVDATALAGAGEGGVAGASFDGGGTFAYLTGTGAWITLGQGYVDGLATDGVDFAGLFSADYCPYISFFDHATGQWTEISPSGGWLLGVSPV